MEAKFFIVFRKIESVINMNGNGNNHTGYLKGFHGKIFPTTATGNIPKDGIEKSYFAGDPVSFRLVAKQTGLKPDHLHKADIGTYFPLKTTGQHYRENASM